MSLKQDFDSVNQQSGSVQQQSGSVQQHFESVEQQSGMVEQQSGMVEQQSGMVEQQSGVVEQPSGVVEQQLLSSYLHLLTSVVDMFRWFYYLLANQNIIMPNTEASFPDRLSRGRTIQATISGFSPAFAPTDPNLSPDAFHSYLNGVEDANSAVSDADPAATNATTDRRTAAEAVQDTALRIKDHVGSNVAWKKYAASIEAASRLVRGTHLPKKAKPAPAAGTPPPKPRQGANSQQGFADIAKNFGKLIAAVQKITGYSAAAGSGLTVAALTAQSAAFGVLNQAVANAEADLAEKQRVRLDYYNGENGLRAKMKAIKLAVRSQYGSRSAQYAAVKGIAL